jgi:hypothetical protein
MRRVGHRIGHRIRLGLLLCLTGGVVCGCPPSNTGGGNARMDAFVELMIPRRIEIQKYLTRPLDVEGGGRADSIEIILAAYDSFGHGIKTTGAFQFELSDMRMASGDKVGRRRAYWRVDIDDASVVASHWDHLSRFFRFELVLPEGELAPGQYILDARLETPAGEMLFDQYTLVYRPESGG